MDTALMLNEITHSALLFDSPVKAVTSLYLYPIHSQVPRIDTLTEIKSLVTAIRQENKELKSKIDILTIKVHSCLKKQVYIYGTSDARNITYLFKCTRSRMLLL